MLYHAATDDVVKVEVWDVVDKGKPIHNIHTLVIIIIFYHFITAILKSQYQYFIDQGAGKVETKRLLHLILYLKQKWCDIKQKWCNLKQKMMRFRTDVI